MRLTLWGVYGGTAGETVYLGNAEITTAEDKGLWDMFKTYFGQVVATGSHPLDTFLMILMNRTSNTGITLLITIE